MYFLYFFALFGFDGVLDFDGYQAYHGAIQHVRGEAERSAECRKVAEKVVALNAAFDTAGIKCNTVTGGGTGTFLFDAGSGLYTEVQPGSYFFWGRGLRQERLGAIEGLDSVSAGGRNGYFPEPIEEDRRS